MPPDVPNGSHVSHSSTADPRRRKPDVAPEPLPQASTSQAAPAAPQRSSLPPRPTRQGPYDRPSGLIKCQGACGMERPRNQFHETQYRNRRKGGKAIMCKDCAPPQQESIKCAECEKVKSASSFSSRQRSNASKAVCSSCQARIDRTNATKRKKGVKGYEDEEEEEDSEEEERQREEALGKGDPYKVAEEEEDPWELYR